MLVCSRARHYGILEARRRRQEAGPRDVQEECCVVVVVVVAWGEGWGQKGRLGGRAHL